jgi:citrate synthase
LKSALVDYREIPKGVIDIIKKFPRHTPPMHALRTAVSALGCFDTIADEDTMDAQRRKARRLIAQIPICVAYFHRARQKKELIHPDPSLGEAANFLYMINGEKPNNEMVSTMDM